jgi:hypothetical protein
MLKSRIPKHEPSPLQKSQLLTHILLVLCKLWKTQRSFFISKLHVVKQVIYNIGCHITDACAVVHLTMYLVTSKNLLCFLKNTAVLLSILKTMEKNRS